ncbi:MAG: tetratricopeptide repeat protein [Elusimicrobia bacterium]|nr:tetratricopeptide repeat protein [Elusimicrobiota bacterium]
MTGRVRLTRVAPFLVFAAAFLAFRGVLDNGFVDWDDPVYLLNNPHFRGFAYENLRWMFTNTLQSVYQPLAWLTLALDHALWGMEPGGYHLQSLLWHCAGAVLFYFVALRLLVLGRGGDEDENAPGALVAALALDWFPLRRIASPRELVARAAEKWPLFLLSGAFGAVGVWAARAEGELAASAAVWSPAQRAAQVAYGLAFYARKTLWPSDLAFLHRMPFDLHPLEARFVLSALGVAAGLASVWALRRRAPAGLAAAAVYLAALFPVVGLMKYGPHLAADRYSNLSGLPLAVLAGAAFLSAARRRRAETWGLAGAVVLALGVRSGRQAATWRDSVALWTRAAAVYPEDARFHANLGAAAAERGDHAAAERELSEAYRLGAGSPGIADEWGVYLASRGRWAPAAEVFAARLRSAPDAALTRAHLADALARLGRERDAEREYRASLASRPSAEAWRGLGLALMTSGRGAEARGAFEAALAVEPADAVSRVDLGLLETAARRYAPAEAQFRSAVASGDAATRALAHHDWGNILCDEGKLAAALPHYAEAARLDPRFVEPRLNLGNTLARLGRFREAAGAYRSVLALDPKNEAAARNLRAAASLSERR